MNRLFNLDGKVFHSSDADHAGDVGPKTLFYYHQKDNYLWAHYYGGSVAIGVLIGKVLARDRISFTYRHFDDLGQVKEGTCETLIKLGEDGLIRLHESWRWTGGAKGSGHSILVEKRT